MSRPHARGPRGVLPLLLVSVVVVVVTLGFARGVWVSNLHNGLLALALSAVGAYVLFQRPAHLVGVLFMITGLVESVVFFGRQVAHGPAGVSDRWWAWLGVWPVVVAFALMTVAVICFPDGRLPGARWRWVVTTIVVVAAVCGVLSALWPVEYSAAGVTNPHPLNLRSPSTATDVWSALAHPAYIAFQIVWVVAVAVRWRAADGLVRRQLTWLVAAAAVSVAALLTGLAIWGTPRPGVLAAALIPVAAGWAIVHGQQVAAYSALTWLSRSGPHPADMPGDFARAVGEAMDARSAILWMGPAEDLQAIGVWPDDGDVARSSPAVNDEAGRHVRTIVREGRVVGAISVDSGPLSLAQDRLLDDLIAQGALVIDHQGLAEVIDRQRSAGHLDGLSPREHDVLQRLARGLSNAAIAEELHLSIKTVEPLVSAIFAKLGLHTDADNNRRVLAALAYLRACDVRAPDARGS